MPTRFSTERFRKLLLDWFSANGKVYPWRETTDPWHIIVSELMLQQTTIPTVLGRYSLWMKQFPTPKALADVDEETALRSWEGLGYYRRVKSLQKIAQAVIEHHNGVFPNTPHELMALPGIGEYTCGALLSFAFNIPAPIVDTNVSRVIARLDNYSGSIDSNEGKKYMWARAAELVDPVNPRAFNSAIMELGQYVCKSKSVECLICPVRECCSATDPLSLPLKSPKVETSKLVHRDIFYVHDGKLLLSKQSEGRHQGMYRLPERDPEDVAGLPLLMTQNYSVTRYKVTRHIYLSGKPSNLTEDELMVPLTTIDDLPMASPDRKALHSPKLAKLLKD